MWQTSLLRGTKLAVLDEVTNGLSYYDYTFLREVPRLHLSLEDELAAIDPQLLDTEVNTFLRMGSWIGGDRDGNPFVTAEILRDTARMHGRTALRFYLEELHKLGAELSLSTRIVRISERLKALADRSPDSRTGPMSRIGVRSREFMPARPRPWICSTIIRSRLLRSARHLPTFGHATKGRS